MQQQRRSELKKMLGELPHAGEIKSKLLSREDMGDFCLERLILELNGYETVPALFSIPKEAKQPCPAVLFNHSHGNLFHLGKKEMLYGCEYMLKKGYAYDLAEAGIATLCIDHMGFEERSGYTESFMFKRLLWDGYIMWGWMVYDSLRALDYLCSREEVDASRIATLGMSMGSTMSQWVAALDERIKVCIDLCCMTNFDELIRQNRLDQHGIYYYVPGLRKHFNTAELNALIAPRAHLNLAGRFDPHTPLDGLLSDNLALQKIYQDMGKPNHWQQHIYPVGHMETHEMRFDAMHFLKEHL